MRARHNNADARVDHYPALCGGRRFRSIRLQVGDRYSVGDAKVHTSYELVYEIMRNGIEPLDITSGRAGETVVVQDVIFPTIIEGGVFGEADFIVAAERKTPLTVIRHAFINLRRREADLGSLFDFLTGRYGSNKLRAGGCYHRNRGGKSRHLQPVISLHAYIDEPGHIQPASAARLDGGRLVFLLIEQTRQAHQTEYEGYVHFAGIVLLMLAMVFITYKDIMKLFTKYLARKHRVSRKEHKND